MTDAEWLTLVLLVVYLIECLSIVPAQSIAIRSRGPGRGRLVKPLLVMPGINRAVIFSNPLSLLSLELLVIRSHVVMEAGQAFVVENLGGRSYRISAESKYADNGRADGPGNIVGEHLTSTSWLHAQFRALERGYPSSSAIKALPFDRRSEGHLQRIRKVLGKRLAPLMILTITQAVATLVVFPALLFWRGLLPALIEMVPLIVALQVLIGIELFRLRRRYLRESVSMAMIQLVPVILFPIGAIRSAVNFARQLPQQYHPELAIVALVSVDLASQELARYGRWLVYAFNAAQRDRDQAVPGGRSLREWRKIELRNLNNYMKTDGLTLKKFLAKSHALSEGAKFCPLCLTEYDDSSSRCAECYDIRLRRWNQRKS